jgi:tetratricopeptide (TPR) repeat protein
MPKAIIDDMVREKVSSGPVESGAANPNLPQGAQAQMQEANQNASSTNTWLIAVLILVTCACYANMLGNAFVYDDDQQILQNPYVKSWKFLPEIFTTTVWSFVGQAGATNYYRPLMTLTFLVLWSIFGNVAAGFHIFSLAVHLAVVLMVYAVGARLFREHWIAWIGALLFALHPIHTEVVDWIAAVPDLEATFFALLALWLVGDLEMADWKAGLLAAFSLLAAMLAKEPSLLVAVLGVGFAALCYWQRSEANPPKLSQIAWRLLPSCCMGLAYVGLRIALFGKLAPVLQHGYISWPQAIYSAFALTLTYCRLLFWPTNLSAFHVFHTSDRLVDPHVLGGIAVLAAFGLLATLAAVRKHPEITFCVFWMGLTLLPVLNARWMAANVLAERYLYLPSVGFCWLVGWCALRLWRTSRNWSAAGTAVRVLATTASVALAIAAWWAIFERNIVWHDDQSLFLQTLRTDPDAAIIRSNLAGVYLDYGKYDQAEDQWLMALAGKPDNVITMNALGVLYTREEKYDQAQKYLLMAIHTRPQWADAYYNYAIVLQRIGKRPQALEAFQQSIKLAPVNPIAPLWYGKALLEDQNYREAEIQFKRSYALQPSDDALRGLADVYLQTGQNDQAMATLRQYLQHSAYDGTAHLQLAKLLRAAGQKEQAAAEYRAVLVTDPGNVEATDALKQLR